MSDDARRRRFFVGIVLDDLARVRCAGISAELMRTGFDAKYEPPEKLHMTLAFLGNVGGSSVEPIASAMILAGARSAAFTLEFDRLGAFPHERKPRVIYVGARSQGEPFRRLAHDVRESCELLGFRFDDDPVAHVTIARVRDPHRPLPLLEFPTVAMRVSELTLFESIFDRNANTTRYEIVRAAPLSVSS